MQTIAATHTAAPTELSPSRNPADSAFRSKGLLWTGRILSGFSALFLFVDGAMKVARADVVMKGSADLGYPLHSIFGIGVVLVICTLLYVLPRTAALGAVLLTGYLGGAIATHVRVDHPLFSHTLFPIYVAALVWGGLYLRDVRVRALLRREV